MHYYEKLKFAGVAISYVIAKRWSIPIAVSTTVLLFGIIDSATLR